MQDTIYKNYQIKIINDDIPENPRQEDWCDNLGTIYYQSRNYTLGDKEIKDVIDTTNCNDWEDIQKKLTKELDLAICIPLRAYEHSGITITATRQNSYPFNCRWDSYQFGFITVSKEKLKQEYNTKRITEDIIKKATEVLLAEVVTFDKYLTGDVYAYRTYYIDPKTGKVEEDITDSCYGYYDEEEALNEAKSTIDSYPEQLILKEVI